MRLGRLDMTRYGRFTNHRLNFGERSVDGPDLHIIYGANEAGKSTSLAAFLDVLFGIEKTSRFNFQHPYPVMRIGASLELSGSHHEIVRVKRDKSSLLDSNDRPISEAVISGALGGIDRASYRAMFSLDDDTLEAGGESILASKGDLGQLLFSASAGLSDLSNMLIELRASADGFYRPHARSGALLDLKNRLTALKSARESIDVAASSYRHLVQNRDRALEQYNDAMTKRAAVRARIEAIQRSFGALPRLNQLRVVRAELLALVEVPACPVGWRAVLPKLQEEGIDLAVRAAAADDDVRRKADELAAIVIDEAVLVSANRIEQLSDLQARYVTAEKDIPARQIEVQDVERAINASISRIRQGDDVDPHRLILDGVIVGVLRDLIAQHFGVENSLGASTAELSDARLRLQDTSSTTPESASGKVTVPSDESALLRLSAIVTGLHDNDQVTRRRVAERARATHLAELTDRLADLHPWQGDAEQLAGMSVPPRSQISLWEAALTAARTDKDRHEAEWDRLRIDRLRLEAEWDAISAVIGVTGDGDISAIRTARESAWANHRRCLDAASADVFEAALRRDDRAIDTRLTHETKLARLHQISIELARLVVDHARANETLKTGTAKLRDIQNEIAAVVTKILPRDTLLSSFDTWLLKRERALETRALFREAERDVGEAERDLEDVRLTLLHTLKAVGSPQSPDASVDTLRIVARDIVGHAAAMKAQFAAVAERKRDVARRERDHESASQRDQAWRAAWRAACGRCWLGELEPLPAPATVHAILPAVAALGVALETRAGLVDRIDRMRGDQRDFAEQVAGIARDLGYDPGIGSPLGLWRQLDQAVKAALNARTLRAHARQTLDAARVRQRDIINALAIHDRRKQEMTAFFGVDTLSDVARKLMDLDTRTRLRNQQAEATREILEALRLPSIEAAEDVLDTLDRTALDAELDELKSRFDDLDQRTRDLFSVFSKAHDQVEGVGGDASVARIEEQRRTTLLEIQEGAFQYLKLRIGIVAAEHALLAYRQKHRSSMMRQASDAFRLISRDAYMGLASQAGKDGEILIAVAADGSSKIASALSKGTRFQLYLALRVAGYHEFARLRPPVPFIADDIMETFDDFRAEEAFRLFAGMATVGQVIYLTHHRHLCDIARRVCPGVRIHELSAVNA